MLHMEQIGRVMRAEMLFHICQKPGGLIARGLDDVAFERREGIRHQCIPGVVIACLCGVFQQNIVAHRLKGDEAQTACKGFILGHGDLLRGHRARQTRRLLPPVGDHGLFNLTVDLLLRPKRSPHKPIQPRHLQQETHQANPTRADFDTDYMERQYEAMEEGESGHTLKERDHLGTCIEAILPGAPGLERAPGDVKRLGGLTLGDPLRLQIAILVKQFGASHPLPSLLAVGIATLFIMEYSSHGYLLYQSASHVRSGRAKDGEVASWLQSLSVASHAYTGASAKPDGRYHDRGPDDWVSQV